ncbi:MAG: XdhC family protein [Acidobacteriota bacterium]
MSKRLDFWRQLADALRRGESVFLTRVADSTDHSPGTPGAALFVAGDGRRIGTIGGGAMELRWLAKAKATLESGESVRRLVEVHHRRDVEEEPGVERSGMICAGRQTNIDVTVTPEDLPTLEAWLLALERERGVLRTDVDGLRVLEEDRAEPRVDRGESRGGAWHGAAWRYDETAVERRRLVILGAGHCGRALARLMLGIGWRVCLFETRAAVVDDPDAADLDVRLVEDFRQAASAVDYPQLTAAVVMTTDVPNDVRALAGALAVEFPFVGAMGSRTKLEEIRRRLLALGLPSSALDRLTAPVGLPIDSHTPPEIAVSVGAQLLACRHRWLGGAGPHGP